MGDGKTLEELRAWSEGDPEALDRLTQHLYTELKALAHAHMRRERSNHTLQTTGLVSEAYLKLKAHRSVRQMSRAQFFGAASTAMRRVLVDYARERATDKRGKDQVHVTLIGIPKEDADPLDVLIANDLVERLKPIDPLAATIIEHVYFGGLTQGETAKLLGISRTELQSRWKAAKQILTRLSKGTTDEGH